MTKLPPQALPDEVNVGVFVGGLTGSLGSLRPCSKSEINEREDLRDYSEAKEMQAMLPERPSSENRDDIIRMAREAGGGTTWWPLHTDTLERFANLVAAAEREAVWNIVFDYAGRKDLSDSDQSLLTHLSDLIRARGEK